MLLKTLESFSPHSRHLPKSIRPGPWPKNRVPSLAFLKEESDRSTISCAWLSMAALASSTSSGVKTPRIIRYPFRSKRYRSSSVISMGYSILGAANVSVELSSVLTSVDCSLEVKLPPLGTGTTELENARMALEVVVVALLLLEVEKAKARTAGVSCRLVKQNIQRTMDRAAKNREKGSDDGIQFSFKDYWKVKHSIVIMLG
mmetsp:Transcript_14703/g.36995  ORF Transcript_14703/g.36995 Transcript_14703/m.36995 type:complete len:202 (-) Transcript_14703:98-703(-)